MNPRATVCAARATSYQTEVIADAIQRVVEPLGGWAALVRRGDRVLVKPNCITHAPPEQPAQTHPAMILETCRQLLDFGAKPFVGDSPAWGSLPGNLNTLGILDELRRMAVPVVEFKNAVRAENPRGQVFGHLSVDRAALEADAIVNLPKFKAHRQLLLTVVIKNMFGCVTGRRKAWWHVKAGAYENYFARMLVETFELLRPAVNIVDAVVAMEGNGPARGTPKPMNLILAATDGPALERVAAEIVGVEPRRMRTLRAAIELGVGVTDLERINLVGASLDEIRVTDFVLPKLLPIGFSLPRLVKGACKNAWIVHQQARQQRSQNAAG